MKNYFIRALILLMLSVFSLQVSASNVIKMGIILGFTGPIESLTPGMAKSAELAWKEVSDSKLLLGGKTLKSVRVDSTCVDASAATANAERLATVEKVAAIYGADCSGVTMAVINNVAAPNGIPMISPSATSPGLSSVNDKGYFFRTAPSDARQGTVLAKIILRKNISKIAITYTNNDYGKGLSDSLSSAYKDLGGNITLTASHEDGKADYSAEVAALAASGAKHLVVLGYVDKGGKGIIQASIDSDAFSQFILADGMIGDSLIKAIGSDLNGTFGTLPGSESDGSKTFLKLAKNNGYNGQGPFMAESYDAAAILALAMQAAGSSDRKKIRNQILNVTNAPGQKIYPGELAKALKIIWNGGQVDYVGASNVEFSPNGDVYGTYKELLVKDGEFKTINVW